jgi:hypothetical protein
VVEQVVAYRIGHAARDLGASGPVEVGDLVAMVTAIERREHAPDLVYLRDAGLTMRGRG